MERTAISPPRACFGLEQHHGNPLCVGCPHREPCADMMGDLVNLVDIDQVQFHFMPPGFADRCPRTDGADPDLNNIEGIYDVCYEWVFGRKSPGNFRKYRDSIIARINESEVSVKMFFLANMLGWTVTHHTYIYPKVLATPYAVEQVLTYAATCQRRFGTFDIDSLDKLIGAGAIKNEFETHHIKDDFDTLMLNSEIIAGSWIVNYKVFHEGDIAKRLYSEKEMDFSPYWLAIEQTYYDTVLLDSFDGGDEGCPDVIRRHRWHTKQVLAKLKKNSRKAITLFLARQRMMPEAVRRVLGQRNLRGEHFQVKPTAVVDPMRFWARLGAAIQHYECLKFVDNIPSIFDRHFMRI